MTVRMFIVGSFLATLGSWSILALMVNFLDPTQAGAIGFLLFYLVLFLSITSTSNLLGYVTRRVLKPQQLAAHAVGPSLRQGVVLGIFCVLILALQHFRLYRWWIAIIAIVIFVALEVVFLSYDRTNRRSASGAQG